MKSDSFLVVIWNSENEHIAMNMYYLYLFYIKLNKEKKSSAIKQMEILSNEFLLFYCLWNDFFYKTLELVPVCVLCFNAMLMNVVLTIVKISLSS